MVDERDGILGRMVRAYNSNEPNWKATCYACMEEYFVMRLREEMSDGQKETVDERRFKAKLQAGRASS